MPDNSNKVRARLLALLDSSRLAPDGRLMTERALAEQLSVGRRTVRRVLETLEAEGLIWRKQGKGTFAGQKPDPTGRLAAEITGQTDPLEVMEARLVIEPALAALCARAALPADVERMRQLARRIAETTDSDAAELWDSALHRLIARTAGNRPLLTSFALLDEIRGTDAWVALRAPDWSLEVLRENDREHRAIIDAIEAGRPEAAETAMRAHIAALVQSMKDRLTAPAEDPAGEAHRGAAE
ncbi:FadR/GntR family transcriptional regulator [Acidimangrovimonas pyrenivorans]|uniref:FadR/GntR family transcriptional regulator n=1 Tax=Acidimangrovimonas pyrenivorans TaxID=2030798 RepID=A0ABV7ALF2_9RHOB